VCSQQPSVAGGWLNVSPFLWRLGGELHAQRRERDVELTWRGLLDRLVSIVKRAAGLVSS
jgi:hypothetical protein